jgi:hypothetical protein
VDCYFLHIWFSMIFIIVRNIFSFPRSTQIESLARLRLLEAAMPQIFNPNSMICVAYPRSVSLLYDLLSWNNTSIIFITLPINILNSILTAWRSIRSSIRGFWALDTIG